MIAESATVDDADTIATLLLEQQRSFLGLDDRFAPPTALGALVERIRTSLSKSEERPLVVRGPREEIVGFGEPGVQELPEGHEWLAWAPRVGGVWESLALPPPGSELRPRALESLVAAARERWQERGLNGETIAWPSQDRDLAANLCKLDLIPSYHYAYASKDSVEATPSNDAAFRPARPEDFASLWGLRSEQEAFHLEHCRFERRASGLERAFREQFDRSVSDPSLREGAPQFSVALQDGEPVGFVEAVVLALPAVNPRGLPEGRYGYVANAAVRSTLRGHGIGRRLVGFALYRLALQAVRGFVLWYADDNPLSSRFWPRMGFRNLVTKYERRFDESPASQP